MSVLGTGNLARYPKAADFVKRAVVTGILDRVAGADLWEDSLDERSAFLVEAESGFMARRVWLGNSTFNRRIRLGVPNNGFEIETRGSERKHVDQAVKLGGPFGEVGILIESPYPRGTRDLDATLIPLRRSPGATASAKPIPPYSYHERFRDLFPQKKRLPSE